MPYVGTDFPPTQPGEQRLYLVDFNKDIALLQSQTATVSGTPTPGDAVGISFTSTGLSNGVYSVIYNVGPTDTLSTIAAGLAALISGSDELTQLGVSASAAAAIISIVYPNLTAIVLDSAIAGVGSNLPTELVLFAIGPYSGETINSATVTCQNYTGGTDPTPQNFILGSPIIQGSTVAILAGNFTAGNNYRLTFIATTALQPARILYSHVDCQLPT